MLNNKKLICFLKERVMNRILNTKDLAVRIAEAMVEVDPLPFGKTAKDVAEAIKDHGVDLLVTVCEPTEEERKELPHPGHLPARKVTMNFINVDNPLDILSCTAFGFSALKEAAAEMCTYHAMRAIIMKLNVKKEGEIV